MTPTIQADSIRVAPDRQRRTFDETALQELIESLSRTAGLLHPIILRESPEGLTLVAGERRLRAVRDIYALGGTLRFGGVPVPAGEVPYLLLNGLSELEREEAELDENIRREDLTWPDRAAAMARLADLKTRVAVSRGEAPPPLRDLATVAYPDVLPEVATQNAAREIRLAKHLHDPEVRGAKTAKDAEKIILSRERAARNLAVAERVGRVAASDRHTLLNIDTLAWLEQPHQHKFDVILSDPPYGMGADEFGDSGGLAAGAHGYADSVDTFEDVVLPFVEASFDLAAPNAHLYLFCDIDKFHNLRDAAEGAGWNVHRTPLIWYKPNGMRTPWINAGPQRKYELVLFAKKGDALVQKIRGDVISCAADANLGHAAQKPIALFRDLLERVAAPGARVLDPFAGTGPILEAGHALGCYVTALEIDPTSYGIAAGRLERITAQGELPL